MHQPMVEPLLCRFVFVKLLAEGLYLSAQPDLYEFMKAQQASHYLRLSGFGLEKDLRHCLTPNTANVLPIFKEGKLVCR